MNSLNFKILGTIVSISIFYELYLHASEYRSKMRVNLVQTMVHNTRIQTKSHPNLKIS
jgi:hypothetical protein